MTRTKTRSNRTQRARELLREGKVTPGHAPGHYLVSSQKGEPGGAYLVSLNLPSCTCPDFSHRRRLCKHILAASLYPKRYPWKGGRP